MPPRIAVATSCFKQPLRQSIHAAHLCRAAGVQLDARNEVKAGDYGETARRQLLHALSERELQVASLDFPLRHALDERENLDSRIAAIRQAMQLAAHLKARVMTIRAGHVDGDAPHASPLQEILEDLAQFGNHVGVTLALSCSGQSPQALQSLIASIKTGPLGLDFDPPACLWARRDPASDLRAAHPLLAHVHVRDGLRDVDGTGRETVVGRGEVDWPLLLALLDEMPYIGWMTVRRTAGDDPLGDCRQAIEYIRRVSLEP